MLGFGGKCSFLYSSTFSTNGSRVDIVMFNIWATSFRSAKWKLPKVVFVFKPRQHVFHDIFCEKCPVQILLFFELKDSVNLVMTKHLQLQQILLSLWKTQVAFWGGCSIWTTERPDRGSTLLWGDTSSSSWPASSLQTLLPLLCCLCCSWWQWPQNCSLNCQTNYLRSACHSETQQICTLTRRKLLFLPQNKNNLKCLQFTQENSYHKCTHWLTAKTPYAAFSSIQ